MYTDTTSFVVVVTVDRTTVTPLDTDDVNFTGDSSETVVDDTTTLFVVVFD